LRPGDRITLSGQYDLLAEPPVDPGIPGSKTDARTQFKIKLIYATILVGDIKGFTSLMEQYANEANLVMKAAQAIFQELSKVINEKHGHLEKIAGDAIMAYWHIEDESGPTAQAVMACNAALEMAALANELAQSPTYWPFRENPFALDIAMATGPVAAGALGHSNVNPALLGDTANLVFRLEKLIGDDRPGDIVVESATYDLAKDQFNFEALGEFPVKGRQKPVTVYRLLDTKPRTFDSTEPPTSV
jgi:adenylate cyclase